MSTPKDRSAYSRMHRRAGCQKPSDQPCSELLLSVWWQSLFIIGLAIESACRWQSHANAQCTHEPICPGSVAPAGLSR